MTSNTTDIMERRRIVAEAIRAESLMEFDISSWGKKTDCGTAGCIAGHAVAVFAPDFWRLHLRGEPVGLVKDKAAEILGLTEEEADGLFVGSDDGEDPIWPSQVAWAMATPDQAADALLSLPAPEVS